MGYSKGKDYRDTYRYLRDTAPDEYASFLNYVVRDITAALHILEKVEAEIGKIERPPMAEAILDKLLTPMIFLFNEWWNLPPEEKMRYATDEYKKKHLDGIIKPVEKSGQ